MTEPKITYIRRKTIQTILELSLDDASGYRVLPDKEEAVKAGLALLDDKAHADALDAILYAVAIGASMVEINNLRLLPNFIRATELLGDAMESKVTPREAIQPFEQAVTELLDELVEHWTGRERSSEATTTGA